MHGARLVSTPAIKRIGSAVSGLDDNRAEMPEKSKLFVGKWETTKKNYQPAARSPKPAAASYNNKTASVVCWPSSRLAPPAESRQP